MGLPWWLRGKESVCQCRRHGFDPWVRKTPGRRKWQPTPVFLPGELHGQRRLTGCSPRGHKESDTTEQLTTTIYSLFSCEKIDQHDLVQITRGGNPEISTHILKGRGGILLFPPENPLYFSWSDDQPQTTFIRPPPGGKTEKPDEKILGTWRPCWSHQTQVQAAYLWTSNNPLLFHISITHRLTPVPTKRKVT